jgi:hypothetical protein
VDVMDITRFTVAQFANGKGMENLEDPHNFWELVQKRKEFEAHTVDDLTSMLRNNKGR